LGLKTLPPIRPELAVLAQFFFLELVDFIVELLERPGGSAELLPRKDERSPEMV
jgi:hypothetical protein